jgi:hypothetical protein
MLLARNDSGHDDRWRQERSSHGGGGHTRRIWRLPAAAGMFAAVLGATMLAAGVPAANAAAGAQQAPSITHSRVVNHTCQTRSAGVTTCEWLVEWIHHNLGSSTDLTTGFTAYASMNGNVNKSIVRIYSYGRRCDLAGLCPPHAVAVLQGPSGPGHIQGHDGARLCAGDVAGALDAAFVYKYWDPKPVSAWITGTAWGKWQDLPRPCHQP